MLRPELLLPRVCGAALEPLRPCDPSYKAPNAEHLRPWFA